MHGLTNPKVNNSIFKGTVVVIHANEKGTSIFQSAAYQQVCEVGLCAFG